MTKFTINNSCCESRSAGGETVILDSAKHAILRITTSSEGLILALTL